MSKHKETEKRNDVIEEKKASDEDQIRFWKLLIGKLHEGISQLPAEMQDMMLRKHAEACVEITMDLFGRMSGRDPMTLDVDDMIKIEEEIEKHYAKHYGKGEATITRKGNIITKWNPAPCYDPKITGKMINPYPAYCDQCNNYYFKGLYEIAHKGPVKVEGLKSALNGDSECLTRIELL